MANPYFPLFTGDYQRDTPHLRAEGHGAYLLLLMAIWDQGGSIKSDMRYLANVARMSKARFVRLWNDDLSEFFVIEGAQISHKRVTAELARVAEISKKRAKSAKSRVSKYGKKPKENNETTQANDKQMLSTQTRGLGSPLTGENPDRKKDDSSRTLKTVERDAAVSAPTRESGGGLPASFRDENPDGWKLWREIRLACSGLKLSTRDLDAVQSSLKAYEGGTLFLEKDISGPDWAALHEAAARRDVGFELAVQETAPAASTAPKLKAIEGGKA